MKRRLAAAILTATVTAGAMALPAAAEDWDNGQQAACAETEESPQQSGWQCAGGNWYYKNADGSYRQGWMRERGQWYFFDGRGVMVTGWAEIDGKAYCFGADGAMLTGSAEAGGKEYDLAIDGSVKGDDLPPVNGIYITIAGIVRMVA